MTQQVPEQEAPQFTFPLPTLVARVDDPKRAALAAIRFQQMHAANRYTPAYRRFVSLDPLAASPPHSL